MHTYWTGADIWCRYSLTKVYPICNWLVCMYTCTPCIPVCTTSTNSEWGLPQCECMDWCPRSRSSGEWTHQKKWSTLVGYLHTRNFQRQTAQSMQQMTAHNSLGWYTLSSGTCIISGLKQKFCNFSTSHIILWEYRAVWNHYKWVAMGMDKLREGFHDLHPLWFLVLTPSLPPQKVVALNMIVLTTSPPIPTQKNLASRLYVAMYYIERSG